MALVPISARQNETLDELVSRAERLRIKEREAEKVAARLNKEKQFNRKVELNSQINTLQEEIINLAK